MLVVVCRRQILNVGCIRADIFIWLSAFWASPCMLHVCNIQYQWVKMWFSTLLRYVNVVLANFGKGLHKTSYSSTIQYLWIQQWSSWSSNILTAEGNHIPKAFADSVTGLTVFKRLLFQIHTVIMPYWAKPFYITSNATKCAWCRFWSLFMCVFCE